MKKCTILFQGDSITDCGRSREPFDTLPPGSGLGSGYPTLIASRLLCDRPEVKWNFLNTAISGNRVVDLYARWKIDTLNLKPDVLSIMIGVNDTWHEMSRQNGVEVPRYARIYHELLEWTKTTLPKIKLVLLEPYVLPFGAVGEQWPAEIDERRKVVKDLAKEFKAVFIPTQTLLNEACKRAPQEHWLKDGVHPAMAGHQLIADAWLAAVKLG